MQLAIVSITTPQQPSPGMTLHLFSSAYISEVSRAQFGTGITILLLHPTATVGPFASDDTPWLVAVT